MEFLFHPYEQRNLFLFINNKENLRRIKMDLYLRIDSKHQTKKEIILFMRLPLSPKHSWILFIDSIYFFVTFNKITDIFTKRRFIDFNWI